MPSDRHRKKWKRPGVQCEGSCPWALGQGSPATYSPADTGLTAGLLVTALQSELPSAKPRGRGLSPRGTTPRRPPGCSWAEGGGRRALGLGDC